MNRSRFGTALGASALLAATAAPRPADAAQPELSSSEYWAHKGGVKLYVYRKRAAAPAGSAAQPLLFLVHGSSMSGRSTFDLTVPGRTGYSMMDAFARDGFDVWTMDHEGYGRSDRTSGNSDIASGVEDLRAAMEVVRRETGRRSASFFGESSGGIRAAAYAVAAPDAVDRLALSAFTWTGKGSPTLANRAKDVEFYRSHNVRPATRAVPQHLHARQDRHRRSGRRRRARGRGSEVRRLGPDGHVPRHGLEAPAR